MTLSIIIVNYKSRELLQRNLESLFAALVAVPFEVIVVDNASCDGTLEMLTKTFPTVRVVASTQNLGFGRANNVGMRIATGKYLVIMNPDISTFPGSLEAMARYMDEHSEVAVLGPKLLNTDRTLQYSCARFHRLLTVFAVRTVLKKTAFGIRERRRFHMEEWDHNSIRNVDWVTGALMCVRAEAILTVGMFDERYFMYFEDVDWCRRFWLAGYAVRYLPSAVFLHHHKRESDAGSIWKSLRRKTGRHHLKSWLRYVSKWCLKPLPLRRTE